MQKLDTATRQKQIVQVSLEIIKTGGIQNLTIKEISKHIGISEQAIYRHFDNKLAILIAIIQYFNEHFKHVFESSQYFGTPLQQIEKLINDHLLYFDRNPATAAVIFSEEIFQNDSTLVDEVHKLVDRRIRFVTALIKKGQKMGEIKDQFVPENLAYIILGTLRFFVTKWRLTNFSFSLQARGETLSQDLIKFIRCQ
ncbi:MAG: TetR/AcrR family transcriptional regulator [Calditrichaceae bacterium]